MIKINKKSTIIISLLLGLCMINHCSYANDLNKVDIKRSNTSSSALNVTIYTANPYNENVAVTKKSDDKYVILMPNISGVNASNIDYSAIKDIVSDVSLKSVDDESNGYTKITLTTTKPVSITTSTKKSTPLTEEQKAYKNLIAQARGYAQTETKTAAPKTTVSSPAKPQEQVSKKQPVSEKNNVITANTKISTPKTEVKVNPQKTVAEQSQAKPTSVKKESPKTPLIPVVNNSSLKNTAQENISQNINIPQEDELKPSPIQEESVNNEKLQTIPAEENISQNVQINESISTQNNDKGTEKNMLTTIIILLSSMFGLIAFFNGIKNSIEGSAVLKKSFKDNLHEKPHEPVADYSDIATDDNLSWQEKYQKYLNSVEEINPNDGILRHIGNGEYEFVNSAEIESIYKENSYETGYGEAINDAGQSALRKPEQAPKIKSHNKQAVNSAPSDVPSNRNIKNQSLNPENAPKLKLVEEDTRFKSYQDLAESLERTLHNSPDIERIDEDSILKQLSADLDKYGSEHAIVHNEEDNIYNSVKKAPKLKTFANKLALEETRRNIVLPKHSSDVTKQKNIESKFVNLESSSLYSSGRNFVNANLSSADLINKNKINTNSRMSSPIKSSTNKDNPYTTISVDEFFDSVDSSSKITAPATLASRVADRLSLISSNTNKTASQNKKSNPLDGKVIRAGYNIDETSGFYIISDNSGKCSLIGKTGNEVTVLKEFSSSVESKLQVRKDGDNVYMVKAADERFLVEINGNKMGVLIEL